MTDKNCKCPSKILTGLIVAAGIALSGYFVAQGLIQFRNGDRSVTVKGLAIMDVEADLAIWPIKHTSTGNDLPAVQQEVEANTQKIIAFLKAQKLDEKDIVSRRLDVTDLLAQSYRTQNAQDSRYIVSETIIVRTGQVENVERAAQNTGDLLKQGVSLIREGEGQGAGNPQYIYTKLNDIKPQMIAEATKSARESAEQFARDSDTNVGQIKQASQGVFQILPRDSDASYQERQERYKTVRVVSTIQFNLE